MKEKQYCPYCASRLIQRSVEGRTRLFCKSCQSPLYENPVPASAVVVSNNNNQILLVKRTVEPKAGWWCLPGGFMELGETPEESALRELQEETGLYGKINRLLGVLINPSKQYKFVLLVGYHVNEFSGDPSPGDDAEAVQFYELSSMPEIAFDSHKAFIHMYYSSLKTKK